MNAPTCCLCDRPDRHLVRIDEGWLCPYDLARYLEERAKALREAAA